MNDKVSPMETARLILNPVSLDCVPAYGKHFVDYEVIRHLSAKVPWPYPADGVRDFLLNVILPAQGHDRWTWTLARRENPSEVIGCIDLWRKGIPEHRGFWLGKAFWGRGLMTEAAVVVNDYAFDHLDFETLVFSNARGNLKSRRVKEKTGARFIGIRPAQFVDPSLTEAETWELTKQDWRSFKKDQNLVT